MNPEVIAVFVPIVAILAGIAVAIVGMLASHRLRLQRAEFRHRERIAAIERGLELPPDPPEFDPRRSDDSRFLRHGLVLVALGIAVTGGLMQLPGTSVPYIFGLIPAACGVAYLLYYAIRRRQRAGGAPAGPG